MNSLVVVAVILAVSPAAAQSSLTIEQAQRLAVERSRMIVAQDAAVTASREMAVAAGQLPDPVATIGVNNLPINGQDAWSFTADFMTMRSVGVMQEFTHSKKREARVERFEREADRSTAERALTIANIQRDTALAWIDRYYAEAQASVVQEQIGQTRLELDAADAAYRAGRGSLAEILSGRSALVSLDDRQRELVRRARAARATLARWVGEAADAPLAGKPDIGAIRLDPRTLDTDIAHHPDLMVLASREEVAAAEVKIAQASKQADWSVSVMYSQRGPAYSNMVSLNASVPLQWDQRNRQDREVAAKLAMLDQVRAEREDMVRAHAAEIRAMVVAWQDDRERLVRYERELVPLARERTEATVAAYRGAKATLGEVLQSRRSEIDVRLQALQLETEIARTWAQLNFLVPIDHASRSGR
jgi:outer membrane protein TolC